MTIDPSKIPGLNIDVESIRTNASDLSTKAGDMRTSGSTIKTTWAGMSSYYSAPEQETLYSAMNHVETDSDDLADDLESIGTYVGTFADTVEQIKKDAQDLQTRAQTFLDTTGKDSEWTYDQDKVDEHNGLVNEASALQVRLWDAERTCANDIRALDGLPGYHADKKHADDDLAYGMSEIPKGATGLPWGDPQQRDDHCPKRAAVSLYRGVVIDFGLGTVNGLAGLWGGHFGDGHFYTQRMDTFLGTWRGFAGLAGFQWDEYGDYKGHSFGAAGNALKETAKGILHWDQWKEDPVRAFSGAACDVGTIFVSWAGEASKVGKFGKAGSTTAKIGRGLEIADKILTYTDPVGTVVGIPASKLTAKVLEITNLNIDPTNLIAKWTGADVDVQVQVTLATHAADGSGNIPDASVPESHVDTGESAAGAAPSAEVPSTETSPDAGTSGADDAGHIDSGTGRADDGTAGDGAGQADGDAHAADDAGHAADGAGREDGAGRADEAGHAEDGAAHADGGAGRADGAGQADGAGRAEGDAGRAEDGAGHDAEGDAGREGGAGHAGDGDAHAADGAGRAEGDTGRAEDHAGRADGAGQADDAGRAEDGAAHADGGAGRADGAGQADDAGRAEGHAGRAAGDAGRAEGGAGHAGDSDAHAADDAGRAEDGAGHDAEGNAGHTADGAGHAGDGAGHDGRGAGDGADGGDGHAVRGRPYSLQDDASGATYESVHSPEQLARHASTYEQLQADLAERADAGDPILNSDGTPVTVDDIREMAGKPLDQLTVHEARTLVEVNDMRATHTPEVLQKIVNPSQVMEEFGEGQINKWADEGVISPETAEHWIEYAKRNPASYGLGSLKGSVADAATANGPRSALDSTSSDTGPMSSGDNKEVFGLDYKNSPFIEPGMGDSQVEIRFSGDGLGDELSVPQGDLKTLLKKADSNPDFVNADPDGRLWDSLTPEQQVELKDGFVTKEGKSVPGPLADALDPDNPWRGNGFAGAKNSPQIATPELALDGLKPISGFQADVNGSNAEMWARNSAGEQTLIAVFREGRWIPIS